MAPRETDVVGHLVHDAGADHQVVRTVNYRHRQPFSVQRPAEGERRGLLTCGRCGATVGYRVLSVADTGRRRRAHLIRCLVAAVTLVAAGAALVTIGPEELGILGGLGLLLVCSAAFLTLGMSAMFYRREEGILTDRPVSARGHLVESPRWAAGERPVDETRRPMPDRRVPRARRSRGR